MYSMTSGWSKDEKKRLKWAFRLFDALEIPQSVSKRVLKVYRRHFGNPPDTPPGGSWDDTVSEFSVNDYATYCQMIEADPITMFRRLADEIRNAERPTAAPDSVRKTFDLYKAAQSFLSMDASGVLGFVAKHPEPIAPPITPILW